MSKIDDSSKGRVYTNVHYAIHQEFGFTVKSKGGGTYVPPQPFMIPGLDNNKDLINKTLVSYLKVELARKKSVSLKPFIRIATQIVHRTSKKLAPVSVRRGIQAPKGLRERPSEKGEALGGHLKGSIKMEVI